MLKIFMIFVEHSSLPGRLEINLGIQYYLKSVLIGYPALIPPKNRELSKNRNGCLTRLTEYYHSVLLEYYRRTYYQCLRKYVRCRTSGIRHRGCRYSLTGRSKPCMPGPLSSKQCRPPSSRHSSEESASPPHAGAAFCTRARRQVLPWGSLAP